ncbi:MAG: tRNA lysidine(34) synthetase TilS [Gammaproteobacteria bacterium]|nr:tRNA lysidine(34) synthetase TilS [Gammaproteobacteria bacterium]
MEDLANKDEYLTGKKIVVALSGGIDSVVLLHFLNKHYPGNVRAVHINHNLSKFSKEWGTFCSALCNDQKIEYKDIDINLENSSNIEENARKKRYLSLKSELKVDEILCTAHHQEDQAETFLLQLFRGSGVAGLASMPKIKSIGDSELYRPFLNISKQKIIDYASKNHLEWIEDDSNRDTNFKRNLLRIEFLPKLSSAFNGLIKNVSRSAAHQAEALKLMQDLAELDIKNFELLINNKIQVSSLIQLPKRRMVNVLRYYIANLGFLLPSNKVLNELISSLSAKTDANVILRWHHYEVRRYNDKLYFFDEHIESSNLPCPYYEGLKNLPNFEIRFRLDGQRIKVKGKSHSQSLKKVLQESSIPPWDRDKLRMYYVDGSLRAMEVLGEITEV